MLPISHHYNKAVTALWPVRPQLFNPDTLDWSFKCYLWSGRCYSLPWDTGTDMYLARVDILTVRQWEWRGLAGLILTIHVFPVWPAQHLFHHGHNWILMEERRRICIIDNSGLAPPLLLQSPRTSPGYWAELTNCVRDGRLSLCQQTTSHWREHALVTLTVCPVLHIYKVNISTTTTAQQQQPRKDSAVSDWYHLSGK